MKKYNIYLDDIRTPVDKSWIVVRTYEDFISKVTEIGLKNIYIISLDHDLGEGAMNEYYNNVSPNYQLNYDNINEKTGLDCAKWLVEQWLDGAGLCEVLVHSANPIGSSNIMGYINNYRMNIGAPQTCVRWFPQFRIDEIVE